MAAPKMRWYLADDTDLSSVVSFSPTAGTPTAEETRNLWNDKGGTAGSETATELRLTALSRNAGDTLWSSSHALAANGYVEVRVTSQAGTGIAAQTSPWTPVGRGRYLHLLDIPSDCKRVVEIRINAPAGYGTEDVEVLLRGHAGSPSVALEEGHHESGAVGLVHGIGDGRFSALLSGGLIEATGTPDDEVHLTTPAVAIVQGVPVGVLSADIACTANDGNSEALTTGQEYWNGLTLAVDGSVTQTKGARGTAPLADSARPTLPEGEPFLAWVRVPYGLVISGTEIEQADVVYGWLYYEVAGLVVTLHPSWLMTDSRLAIFTRKTVLSSLAASDTNYVYFNPGGTYTVNQTGVRPEDRSLLVYEFDTDGSTVTAARLRAPLVGRPMVALDFFVDGTISAADEVYRVWPHATPGYIVPLVGILAAMGSPGGTSGSTIFDLEQSDAAGVWTTHFTSSGTDDQRPTIAYNATDPRDSGAIPEVYRVEPFARLRSSTPTVAGTPGSNAGMTVLVVPVDC